jgi:hypothetical protein
VRRGRVHRLEEVLTDAAGHDEQQAARGVGRPRSGLAGEVSEKQLELEVAADVELEPADRRPRRRRRKRRLERLVDALQFGRLRGDVGRDREHTRHSALSRRGSQLGRRWRRGKPRSAPAWRPLGARATQTRPASPRAGAQRLDAKVFIEYSRKSKDPRCRPVLRVFVDGRLLWKTDSSFSRRVVPKSRNSLSICATARTTSPCNPKSRVSAVQRRSLCPLPSSSATKFKTSPTRKSVRRICCKSRLILTTIPRSSSAAFP